MHPLTGCGTAVAGTDAPGLGKYNLPDVAKLADAPDLGSGGVIHVGSTPIIRTIEYQTRNKE